MFTEKLFNHTYDIDELIRAFCDSSAPAWQLDTSDGSLTPLKSTGIDTSPKHIFEIAPLPESFTEELKINLNKDMQVSDIKLEIKDRIDGLTTLADLPHTFENDRAGGWLREQVKTVVLEWLDMHNLIPPSMRHVRAKGLPSQGAGKISININMDS
tara:strand:- start:599 stop:1066 length:468 start_codon:yes stop_codon:yes gene_type:complete